MKHARKLAATSKKRKRQRYLEVAHDRGKEELLAIYREDDQATYDRIKEEALTVYPNGQGRKERHPLTDSKRRSSLHIWMSRRGMGPSLVSNVSGVEVVSTGYTSHVLSLSTKSSHV